VAARRVALAPGERRRFGSGDLAGRRELALAIEVPGLYQVSVARGATPLAETRTLHFAATLDPEESDLRPAGQKLLAALSGTQKADGSGRPVRRVGLWSGLAVALLALLVVEAALARRAA
jgi:hypothetical protein